MTATISEIEILDALDFDFAPPCGGTTHHGECDKTAVWKATIAKPCGTGIRLWCDEHYQYCKKWWEWKIDASYCADCNSWHTIDEVRWIEVVRLT